MTELLFALINVLIQHTALPPTLHLEEDLRLGSQNGPIAFSIVGGLAVLDSTLIVTQPREGEVWGIFLPDRSVRWLGTQGNGPGEYSRPAAIGVIGDTVWIEDFANRRVTLLSASGEVLKTQRLSRSAGVLGVSTGGGVLGILTAAPNDPVHVVRFRDDGSIQDTIVKLVSPRPQSFNITTPRGGVYVLNPYSHAPMPLLDNAHGGICLIQTDGPAGREVEIAWIAPDGSRRRAFVPIQRRPVTDREWTELFATLPPEMRDQASRRLARPRDWTPVNRAVVASNGDVWIGQARAGERTKWTVVSPTAGIIGNAETPAAVRLHLIDGDAAWGMDRDELDVPYAVRFRITRP